MIKNKVVYIMLLILLFSITSATIVLSDQMQYLDTISKKNIAFPLNINTPPNPPIIEGPTSGKTGVYYEYYFTLTDDDEDDFLQILEVDFGDEVQGATKKTCEKPWENGTIITMENKWSTKGDYQIIARVMDSQGEWSEWSDPFEVSMPKTYSFANILRNRIYHFFSFFL